MNIFRMRTSDVEGVQIDAQYQQFLEKEHGIHSNVGDYLYRDVKGDLCVMEKDRFERLFAPVPVDLPAAGRNWLQSLMPSLA